MGFLHWVTLRTLRDPSGLHRTPKPAPSDSGHPPSADRSPVFPLAQLSFPRDDPWLLEQPCCRQRRARDEGQVGGHCPKQGTLRPRGKETLCKPGTMRHSGPFYPHPRSAQSLPPPRGGGGPGRANERNRKFRTEGREMRRWDKTAGADLRLRLQLPSTPGHQAVEKAGAAARSSLFPSPLTVRHWRG